MFWQFLCVTENIKKGICISEVTEVAEAKSLQRAEVDKMVVRMTNFPYEIHPVRPPGIETLLHGGLSSHSL